MALVLKLKTIEGTTLWNFLDALGTENPGDCACDLRYLAWDSREPVVSLIESDTRNGGWLGRSRQSLKTSTHGFNLSAATKDGLLTGYNALAAHLANGKGKYFEYQLNAATATEYLDFTHGWPAALLMDEDSAKWVEDRIRAPNLPVTIVHQPFFRLDEIDAALNKLTNATLLCDENNDGRPNDWTWVSDTNISAESITNGWYNFTVSASSERDLGQVWTGAVPGDVITGNVEAYTDNATNGRMRISVSFYTSGDVFISEAEGSLVTPSTDVDSPTLVEFTTPAAPATTAKARLGLQSVNTAATAVPYHWRNANLSRTNSAPETFRSGVETINNDPASTTSGQRARVFVVDVRSDAPVEGRLKLQGNGANYGEPVRVAAVPISHPADFEKWVNRGKYHNLGGATVSNGATAVADSDGSGAGTNAINIPGASATNLTTKFASVTVTPSTYGLRGKFLLVPRLRATVINDDWSVKILWGMSTSTPPYDMPILSLPDLSSTFTEEKVGTINLLEDADPFTLKFDIYARRDGGTGDLRLNIFSFIPVSQISTLQGSGALVGATDYLVTDPGAGAVEKFNSSDQFLDFVKVTNGSTPFVLEPGLNAIYVADELGNLTGTVKASITYSPCRHA